MKTMGDGPIYQLLGKHREDSTCTRTRVEAGIAAGGAGIGAKVAKGDEKEVARVAGGVPRWRILIPR